MNIMVYFSPETLSNSYILCPEHDNRAILVDPRAFDVPLFQLIDSRKLEIVGILLTHCTPQAGQAIRTIKSLYDPEVFGGSEQIEDIRINNIHQKRSVSIADLHIEAIRIPGLHTDSTLYRVEDCLFSGDVLSAGTMAESDGTYGRAIMIQAVRELLKNLNEGTRVLPLHGPPSTVGIERETNMDILVNEDPITLL